MRIINKTETIKIIHDCAVLYDRNLSGNNILFLTTRNNLVTYFESLFMNRNFMHLTGVKSYLNSESFFRAAILDRLNPNDIAIMPDGMTDLKLGILPQLMNIHISARMVGEYDYSHPLLVADKFAGTITMAMGFVRVNDMFVPNTTLKKDIRDITIHATRHQVTAIFVKERHKNKYTRLTYIAKNLTIDDFALNSNLYDKVDFANLTASFDIPKKSIIEH
jgi:hypothetical protein